MASFSSDIEQAGPNVTVHVSGPEASHTEMSELVAACCDRMRYENASNFVFDLEKVEFLASACIGSLVELLREVEPMRGKIAIANCDDNVAFSSKSPSSTIFSACSTTSTKHSNHLRNRMRGSEISEEGRAAFYTDFTDWDRLKQLNI